MNDLFRAHVTRVSFDLSLGKSHIAALVYLNESINRREYIKTGYSIAYPHRRAYQLFATGSLGLLVRGLIIHHHRPEKKNGGMRWHYTITPAGKLVIRLLKEAGLYQEYVDALLPQETVDDIQG